MAQWQRSSLTPTGEYQDYNDDEFDDDDDDDFDYVEEDPYEEVGAKLIQSGKPIQGYMDYTYDIGSTGRGPGQFGGWIQHFAISDDGQTMYACDVFNRRIQIISLPDRKCRHSFSTNIAQFNFQARGIAVLRGGNICVNCAGFNGSSRIGIFSPEGRIVSSFGENIIGASSAMTVDNMDRISVIDRRKVQITTMSKDGQSLNSFPNPVKSDSLRFCANSKGDLIIPDHLNNFAWLCDENGTVVSRIAPPQGANLSFRYPAGVTVDVDDNILICDVGNHCVTKFDSDGNYCGPILSKIDQSLWRPHDIVTSKQGQVFLSEISKTYVRMFQFTNY